MANITKKLLEETQKYLAYKFRFIYLYVQFKAQNKEFFNNLLKKNVHFTYKNVLHYFHHFTFINHNFRFNSFSLCELLSLILFLFPNVSLIYHSQQLQLCFQASLVTLMYDSSPIFNVGSSQYIDFIYS